MKNSPRLQRCSGAGCSLPAALFLLTATTTPVAAQNFVVEYVDEKLSVQANNSRVKELLLEIQDKTGIEVNFIADPKDTVSLDISEQSVESVIGKITENHMIIHDMINGKKTISELIIISDDPELISGGGGSANLPSGQPAPAISPEANNQPANDPAARPAPENAPNPSGDATFPPPPDSTTPLADPNQNN